jgi:hypothetical protein
MTMRREITGERASTARSIRRRVFAVGSAAGLRPAHRDGDRLELGLGRSEESTKAENEAGQQVHGVPQFWAVKMVGISSPPSTFTASFRAIWCFDVDGATESLGAVNRIDGRTVFIGAGSLRGRYGSGSPANYFKCLTP